MQIWRICSYYEFARECNLIRYCINQNTTLDLLLKSRIKITPLNLLTATPRVYFASTEGLKVHDKNATDKSATDKSATDKIATDKSVTKSLSKGIQHTNIKK